MRRVPVFQNIQKASRYYFSRIVVVADDGIVYLEEGKRVPFVILNHQGFVFSVLICQDGENIGIAVNIDIVNMEHAFREYLAWVGYVGEGCVLVKRYRLAVRAAEVVSLRQIFFVEVNSHF